MSNPPMVYGIALERVLKANKRNHRQKVRNRIFNFLLFGVLASFIPILFRLIEFYTQKTEFTISDVVFKGDIFLIISILAVNAIGNALLKVRQYGIPKGLMMFTLFLAAIISAYIYGTAHFINQTSVIVPKILSTLSVTMILMVIFSGIAGILLEEAEQYHE